MKNRLTGVCSRLTRVYSRLTGVYSGLNGVYSLASGENLEVLLVSVILFRFGRFGCFGGFVSLISVVSVVSFRWFPFVVSGFSTCPGPPTGNVTMSQAVLSPCV